jgi:carbonic anhydrase
MAVSNLLASNAAWASSFTAAQHSFFTESAKGQSPPVLWIGCADSRVPESVITNQVPGQIFTHVGGLGCSSDRSATLPTSSTSRTTTLMLFSSTVCFT